MYDADDLCILGNIYRLFPGFAHTPFGSCHGNDKRIPATYSLPLIEQFMREADEAEENGAKGSIICESNVENIFFVPGCLPRPNELRMVSVRKKLNSWHIDCVLAGDKFRGPNVYVFM